MIAESRFWRRSSYSNGSGGNCVELAGTLDAVRDSKNGDVLRLSYKSVAALLTSAKAKPDQR